jgi:hypothetical protein
MAKIRWFLIFLPSRKTGGPRLTLDFFDAFIMEEFEGRFDAWSVRKQLIAGAYNYNLKESIMNERSRSGIIGSVLFGVTLFFFSLSIHVQASVPVTNSVSAGSPSESTSRYGIWETGIGQGFRSGSQSLTLTTGAGYGLKSFGSQQSHDLALLSVAYGYMLGTIGRDHWYRGNGELRGEFFSGAQFSPSSDWLVGVAPHLRYNFATGTRWVPYLDAGAGVSATSIGPPDLSHYFEFNLQATAGVRWFIRDNVAVCAETRFVHLSCAEINTPNLGANTVLGMVGVSWFF